MHGHAHKTYSSMQHVFSLHFQAFGNCLYKPLNSRKGINSHLQFFYLPQLTSSRTLTQADVLIL